MLSISRQFHANATVEPLSFEFKVVKKFERRTYKDASELICWSFITGRRTQVAGFRDGCSYVCFEPADILVKLNRYGVFDEILVHDYSRAFILRRGMSGSDCANMIDILTQYSDGGLYHASEVQNVIFSKEGE
jgi:hypothetical protein